MLQMLPWTLIGVLALVLFLVWLLLVLPVLSLYIQALTANAAIPLPILIGMRFRKTLKPGVITYIRSKKIGLDVQIHQIETHILAGGRVADVVTAMMIAKAAGEPLSWDAAAALDLQGDVKAELTSMLHKAGKLAPGEKLPAI